jgi:hypothetical protein
MSNASRRQLPVTLADFSFAAYRHGLIFLIFTFNESIYKDGKGYYFFREMIAYRHPSTKRPIAVCHDVEKNKFHFLQKWSTVSPVTPKCDDLKFATCVEKDFPRALTLRDRELLYPMENILEESKIHLMYVMTSKIPCSYHPFEPSMGN